MPANSCKLKKRQAKYSLLFKEGSIVRINPRDFIKMEKKKLAIVGCGKLADIVVDALLGGILDDYKLIGSFSNTFEKAERLAERINTSDAGYRCTPCSSMADLIALKPDYIVESAAPVAMRELALPALKNGSSIVTLSIGALADEDFYKQVQETAKKHGTRVHLVSGSIGGFDVLRTASLMGDCAVTFATEKSPKSLRNTSVYDTLLETETKQVFSGNAKEAIALFPTKVNVAVAAALASVGPQNTKVSVTSVPDYIGDDHRIEIKNEEVHAIVDVYSKTSKIAGWSVVNTLRNITSPIVF